MKLYKTLRWLLLLLGLASCGHFVTVPNEKGHYFFIRHHKVEFEIQNDSLYTYEQAADQ